MAVICAMPLFIARAGCLEEVEGTEKDKENAIKFWKPMMNEDTE